MTYEVKLAPDVYKFLKKGDSLLLKRVKYKLSLIKEDPFIFLNHLEGNDFFKLRIGDYRLIIDVDTSNKIIFVRYIGHRKNIYKYLDRK